MKGNAFSVATGASSVTASNKGHLAYRQAQPAGGTQLVWFNRAGKVLNTLEQSGRWAEPHPSSWSRDGKYLLYYNFGAQTGTDLWVLPLTGERKPIPVANSPFNESRGQFSPDGRWIAYDSDESGRPEVYVKPFPTLSAKYRVSTEGGDQARWRGDGKELFYVRIGS